MGGDSGEHAKLVQSVTGTVVEVYGAVPFSTLSDASKNWALSASWTLRFVA